jgi:aryl-alcohol dehydrogenase-like predicted oxidoreductase
MVEDGGMKQRRLGAEGPLVSAIGLGCMAMSEFYGPAEDAASVQVIHRALDLGLNFFDTADVYGRGANEELVGRALRARRDDVAIATKFGNVRREDGAFIGVNGRPDYVKRCCDASLQRLGTDRIDLYDQHRVDPEVPIEETVGAMADLVSAGKVRWIGLSEAAPATVRRAQAAHPIAALQTEYSLWSREPEEELLDLCAELGIAFVAYSPLGRGLLTGAVRATDELAEGDVRRNHPRFQGENLEHNLRMVRAVEAMAAEKGCTAAQLALSWVMSRAENIIPIPGTRSLERLEQNVAATELQLEADDLRRLEEIAPPGAAAGTRYPERGMRLLGK